MRIISCFIVVLFFFNLTIVIGQKNKFDTLNFIPIYGSIPLKIDDAFYAFKDKDSIQFDELKFYISEVELINGNKLVWKEPNSYHLIDASNLKSLQIILNIPQNISFQKVKFSLGVDSIVNVSGVKGGIWIQPMGCIGLGKVGILILSWKVKAIYVKLTIMNSLFIWVVINILSMCTSRLF